MLISQFVLLQVQQQPTQDPWPQQPQQQQQARRPQVDNTNNNQKNNRPYTGPLADSKPFVRCPSAMKCVPKVGDFLFNASIVPFNILG